MPRGRWWRANCQLRCKCRPCCVGVRARGGTLGTASSSVNLPAHPAARLRKLCPCASLRLCVRVRECVHVYLFAWPSVCAWVPCVGAHGRVCVYLVACVRTHTNCRMDTWRTGMTCPVLAHWTPSGLSVYVVCCVLRAVCVCARLLASQIRCVRKGWAEPRYPCVTAQLPLVSALVLPALGVLGRCPCSGD